MKQVDLLPPAISDLQLNRFLKNGEHLISMITALIAY